METANTAASAAGAGTQPVQSGLNIATGST